MKTKHYLGGLTLGALIGVGIGYWIATDPKKRRKIGRFINDVEDKFVDVKDGLVEKYEDIKGKVFSTCGCGCEDDLTDDDRAEIEAIIIAEAIQKDDATKE